MAEFSRREVNRALLASALALIGKPSGATVLLPAAAPRLLFNFAIAGGYYNHLRATLPNLKPGITLILKREADNPHDVNAVAVHAPDGAKLGYIPREANYPIAVLLDAGQIIRAEIVTLLDVNHLDDIPDDLVFTGFSTGEPMVNLSLL